MRVQANLRSANTRNNQKGDKDSEFHEEAVEVTPGTNINQ